MRPYAAYIWMAALLLWSSVDSKSIQRTTALDAGHARQSRSAPPATTFFGALWRRDPAPQLRVRKAECLDLHHAKDKCAFVVKHCEDERVGVFDYLELYYCRFRHAKPLALLIMALWLGLLFTTIGIAASDFFCVNLSTIAHFLGMSESLAGVTFLALGNGSPDVFSTFAAMKINAGSLAVGELIGAASFISAVVAGSMAIVRPFKVGRRSFVRDISFFAIAIIFGILCLVDGKIKAWECALMIAFYLCYVAFVIGWHWYSGLKRRRRQKERRARTHHTAPEDQELLGEDDESDEDEGVGNNEGDQLLNGSTHDFGALERGQDADEDEDEEDVEHREFAELSDNIRRSRPKLDQKLAPLNAPISGIRPSLVSALEFKAVLNSLGRDKNLSGRQILLRRYSDEPFIPEEDATASESTIPPRDLHEDHTTQSPLRPNAQAQAVSANDIGQAVVGQDHNQDVPGVVVSQDPDTSQSRDEVAGDPRQGLDAPRANSPSLLIITPTGALSPSGTTSPERTGSPSPTSPSGKSPPQLVASDSNARTAETSQRIRSPLRSPRPPSLHLSRDSVDSSVTAISSSEGEWKRVKYWPYKYLPPPQEIFQICFPTLINFPDKNVFEKIFSIVALPSVLLLTITLPVVDDSKKNSTGSPTAPRHNLPPESPASITSTAASTRAPESSTSAAPWHRWLASIQCLAAPLAITILIFPPPRLLPTLYALLVGLALLLTLLLTTSPSYPPRFHKLFTFFGFIVSIAWISTIATEVVGVLKALGNIFSISDAILGLTIFAVGNSLGDLVADITIARLGYPVMALSACFGGPMMNILLGVGVSGLYMTTGGGSYRIEVSSTLLISAATLLVTLLVLLVVVPLKGYWMSRGVGWTLIGLWTAGTIINLVVEVTGVGGRWNAKELVIER